MHRSIRKSLSLLALAIGCAVPSFAKAQTITATLNTVDPYVFGHVNLSGAGSLDGGIGNIDWTGVSSNVAPFNSTFNTYCIDLIQDISFGNSYTYTIAPLSSAPNSGAYPGGTPTTGMGASKADELEALYGVDYGSTLGTSASEETAKEAFQLAIWNIVYDTDSTVSSGTFSAGSDVSTAAISVANGFLSDALNPSNQQYDATNLIALLGQNGAQDQIAMNGPVPIDAIPQGAPLPSSGAAGMVLLGAVAAMRLRRRILA